MNQPLSLWTRQHAILMTAGILAYLLERSSLPLVAMAGGSMLGLLVRFRGTFTPKALGAGNTLSLLRAALALGLMTAHDLPLNWTLGIIAVGLVSDGLDGWIARKTATTSALGEILDQESDALFFLAICLLLIADRNMGPWILLPASYRYLFVLLCHGMKWAPKSIKGTWFTRGVGITAMIGLAACLSPLIPAEDVRWIAGGAGFFLSLSFLQSGYLLYRSSPPPTKGPR